MNVATGSDLKKECMRAEQRCTTHPYGSKAASRVLFDLSRNVQSKIVESRQIDDPNAVELSKLREFRTEWETYFGNVFQGEMGVVPMTPAAAAETIRAQGASIKDLEKELTREREDNKDVQAALQSALLTHQESAHRAARVESERINRQFEALTRKHEAELKRERGLRAQALKASQCLRGDTESTEELKRHLASSANEAQQLRSKAANLESRLNGAIDQAQAECEVLLKSRELHWRHKFTELQEEVRTNPVVLQLRERENDLTKQLIELEGRYKAEVGALKRRLLEEGRLNNALRKALEEQRRR